MRTGKILGMIVGGVLVLFVITLLGVWLFVNPNNYKGRIEKAVKDSTGRDLLLQGDIKLSVFPWIALELGPATLGNPPGFGDTPFVAFQHAAVRVKLLPLLSKRLEVGRIELDGLDVRLQKNAEGKGNWEGFGKSDTATKPESTGSTNSSLEGIAGIAVKDARVSLDKMTVDKINVETGAFAEKGIVPISVSFEANRGTAGESATVSAKFSLSVDSQPQQYRIVALELNSVVSLAGNNRPIRWNVSAPTIDLNLAAQTLSIPEWSLNAAGAQVNGSLAGTQVVDDMDLKGKFALQPLVVREYLPRLGMTAPITRDPKAFASVSASSAFAYGKKAVHLDDLLVTLDDSHLKGTAAIVNLETNALRFDLDVDTIDIDRYLGPENQKPAPTAKPAEDPTKTLRALDLNGTLTVGKARFSAMDFTNVKMTLEAKDGVMHLFPSKAQIYSGQYSGDITVDSRGAVPTLSMDEHLTAIDMARLTASNGKNGRLSGRGNVNIKGTAKGSGSDAILKTLDGRLDANVANGAVEGIDLGFEVARAQALLRKEAPGGQSTGHTTFDALKMSADITNGVAATKDLLVSSQFLKVTGQGTANLATKAIDFAVSVDALKAPSKVAAEIPVKITGTMSDPTVRPDIEALAKGQLKQKVQDLLQDKLKGLFGKP